MKTRIQTGLREWRTDSRAWLREHGFELWIITGIWAILSVVIFWLATGHESPRRYQDEFLFWGVAKSFAEGLGLTWRGTSLGLRSWLYPVLLAPAFWIGSSVAASYTIVHMINSLMIVGTLFPAFLMARMYVGRGGAILAALMAVSVPALNYAGVIGTENLAYLTGTAAFAAILFSIWQPRLRNWILAFAAIAVAALTRTQFIIFLPIFFATLVLAGLMREPTARREYFSKQKWLIIANVTVFAIAGLAFLVLGRKVVGLYGGVFDGVTPTWDAVKFWIKAFASDVYVLAGIVPVIATFALLGDRENRRDPLRGALIALALVASLAFVLQISWFSATNPYDWRGRHIFYERYMFYLGPIFFTGFFAAWKRVSLPAAIISTVVAFLVMTGFQTDSVLVPFSYDSFGFSLIGWYMDAHPAAAPNIGALLARITLLLGVIYLFATLRNEKVSRAGMFASTLIVFVILGYGQVKTWQYARLFSHDAFLTVPRPASFIDQNTDQDVGMIVTSTDAPEMYFTTEFWNDRVVRAFATDQKPIQSPIMYSPRCEFDWNAKGEILGTGCDKVPNAFFMRSETVVMHLKDETKRVHPTADWRGLTLMVGEPPPRILSIVDGYSVRTGSVQGLMNVRTFLDKPGELRLRLGKAEEAHVVKVGDDETRVPANSRSSVTVPIPADDHTTTVTVNNTDGVPGSAQVSALEVREPGGKWRSIL